MSKFNRSAMIAINFPRSIADWVGGGGGGVNVAGQPCNCSVILILKLEICF